jgi:hypothetical protein
MFEERNKEMNKNVRILLSRVLRGIKNTKAKSLSDEAEMLLKKEDLRATEVWNLCDKMINNGWKCEKLMWKYK